MCQPYLRYPPNNRNKLQEEMFNYELLKETVFFFFSLNEIVNLQLNENVISSSFISSYP